MGSHCSSAVTDIPDTATKDHSSCRALATQPPTLGDTRRLSLHTASGASRSTTGDTTQGTSDSPLPTNSTHALRGGSSTLSDTPPLHIVPPLSTSFSHQQSVQNPISVTSMPSEQTPNSVPNNSGRGIQPRRWSTASMSKDSEVESTSTHSSRLETSSQQRQTPTMNVRPPIGPPSSSSKGAKKRNRIALSSFSSVLTKEEADAAEGSIKAASSNTFIGAAAIISAESVATEDDQSPMMPPLALQHPTVETAPASYEWSSSNCRGLGSFTPDEQTERKVVQSEAVQQEAVSMSTNPLIASANPDSRPKVSEGRCKQSPLVAECSGSNLSIQQHARGNQVCVPNLLPPLASWSHEHDGHGCDPMNDSEGFLSMARVNSESFDSAKRSCESEGSHY